MHPTLRRVLFTLLALVPPVIVAYLRVQLDDLVSFTGGFAGLGIMFLFPTLFVFFARRFASSFILTPLDDFCPSFPQLVLF